MMQESRGWAAFVGVGIGEGGEHCRPGARQPDEIARITDASKARPGTHTKAIERRMPAGAQQKTQSGWGMPMEDGETSSGRGGRRHPPHLKGVKARCNWRTTKNSGGQTRHACPYKTDGYRPDSAVNRGWGDKRVKLPGARRTHPEYP